MNFEKLSEEIFSIVKDNDPYRVPKLLQLKEWCYAFLELFRGNKKLTFFLDVLSDEECWEKTDTTLGIKLNRRIAAKKMVEPKSRSGETNPLDDKIRYKVACWCCLEEDVVALFEHYKRNRGINEDDIPELRKLVEFLSRSYGIDRMMKYWSHVASGLASELLSGERLLIYRNTRNNLYVYGLDRVLYAMYRFAHIEAVEFFWNKVKSLPKDELSAQRKDKILMEIACYITTTWGMFFKFPEVFKFIISQISSDKYPEFLEKDFAENKCYSSLKILQKALCFDQFQRLFDCLKPCDVPVDEYRDWLYRIGVQDYSGHLARAGMRLFIHMWMKESFDGHRASVLRMEIENSSCTFSTETLLIPFTERALMEPVFAVLDKASPDQIKEYMSSKQADHLLTLIKRRCDIDSLDKFASYTATKLNPLGEDHL